MDIYTGQFYSDIHSTVCFSGYRPEKFSFSLEEENSGFLDLRENIETALIETLKQGYRTYLCGMAKGFDLLCGKILLEIMERNKKTDARLIAVIPHKNHDFSDEWGQLHRQLRAAAVGEVIISHEYAKKNYLLRNRFMVENSSCLVCYWDGQKGGTAQTVRLAKRQGHAIHNLARQAIGLS
ncbi:MAG: SLOG family protein [Defluviitaleaceae bacterium]|nr:SLOG family protein [Defluviitaleaceae bacterium]